MAPFWSFGGWVLLRISLGLAVRTFWSDLEKHPKSASGQIWRGWVNIFWPGALFGVKNVPEKHVLWRNDFVVGF